MRRLFQIFILAFPILVWAMPDHDCFSILSPKNAATIWNNNGDIAVQFSLKLKLDPESHILLYMDEKPMLKTRQTAIVLHNIDRGTHTLSAKIVDGNGRSLAVTGTIIIYLHRAIVKPVKQVKQDLTGFNK